MKFFVFFTLFMFSLSGLSAQEQIKISVITLVNETKIDAFNLRYEEDKILYTNLENMQEEHLFQPSVLSVEEVQIDQAHEYYSVFSNGLYKPRYPDGIYGSKEDFLKKRPSDTTPIISIIPYGFKYEPAEDGADVCYFYYKETEKKVKNVFAVSYNGYLYFQTKAILKNKNKNDKGQGSGNPNFFVRVKMGGDNFYYTEVSLANESTQGLGYALGGAVGGVIAQSSIREKGVVWDKKMKEFNIFKNCKDYNDFIRRIYPEGVDKCTHLYLDVVQIRETMNIIK